MAGHEMALQGMQGVAHMAGSDHSYESSSLGTREIVLVYDVERLPVCVDRFQDSALLEIDFDGRACHFWQWLETLVNKKGCPKIFQQPLFHLGVALWNGLEWQFCWSCWDGGL